MNLTVIVLKASVIIAGLAFLANGLANPSIKNKPWFAFGTVGVTILFIMLIVAIQLVIASH
ncbi:MAG: hypothetical protein JSU01_19115 [Bacteroidetes bacterium]|nr:hypothetical protein [Bacteroidota bacterium]